MKILSLRKAKPCAGSSSQACPVPSPHSHTDHATPAFCLSLTRQARHVGATSQLSFYPHRSSPPEVSPPLTLSFCVEVILPTEPTLTPVITQCHRSYTTLAGPLPLLSWNIYFIDTLPPPRSFLDVEDPLCKWIYSNGA